MYEYNATIVNIVDADTVDVMIDLGFSVHVKNRLRLWGIDAWESRTSDPEEKKKGLRAKERLIELLADGLEGTARWKVQITSHGLDKYGRSLATVMLNGVDINQKLVEEGHAVVYGSK